MSTTQLPLQLCEQYADQLFFADLGITFADLGRAVRAQLPRDDSGTITLTSPTSYEARTLFDWTVKLLAALEQGLVVALKAPGDPYEFPVAPFPGPGLMLKTSGSTAHPKVVFHPWENARLASERFFSFFGAKALSPWQLNLPLHHIGGLSLLLRCLFKGLAVVSLPDRELLHPQARAISLVPTQLLRLLKNEASLLSQFDLILVGGAPASRELRQKAAAYSVSYSYGLSESFAVVGATRPGASEDAYFFPGIEARLDPISSGLELRGPGLLQASFKDGRWQNYENSFYPTHDRALLGAAGKFEIRGRLDETIISGGEKILLSEVEALLRAQAQIEEVRALGLPDREWGEALILFLTPFTQDLTDFARQTLRSQLGPHYTPKLILPFPSIPTGAIKLTKNDLLDYARAQAQES